MRNDPSAPAMAPATMAVPPFGRRESDARAIGASLFASTTLPRSSPAAAGACAGVPVGVGPCAGTKRTPLAIMRPRATVACLLYTSDAADERSSVDLGGRRII